MIGLKPAKAKRRKTKVSVKLGGQKQTEKQSFIKKFTSIHIPLKYMLKILFTKVTSGYIILIITAFIFLIYSSFLTAEEENMAGEFAIRSFYILVAATIWVLVIRLKKS